MSPFSPPRLLIMGLLAALLLALAGCDEPATAPSAADATPTPSPTPTPTPLRIVVTIPPIEWAVRGLAPDDADITLLMPPGVSPHGFELTPAQVMAIAKADVLVMAGAMLEPPVEAALRAHASDTRRVVRFEEVVAEDEAIAFDHEHHHHEDGEHNHGPIDPHFWLDPLLMERFVDKLAAEFGAPAGKAAPLREACRGVHAEYASAIGALPRRTLVVQHSAYAYLCDRYGLEVGAALRPMSLVAPSPRDIAAAKVLIETQGVRAIYIEPQISRAEADRLASKTGVKVLMLDPLGEGDWPKTMRANLGALVEGLGGE